MTNTPRDMWSPSTHDSIMAMRSVPFAKIGLSSAQDLNVPLSYTVQWHARNQLRYAFCLSDDGRASHLRNFVGVQPRIHPGTRVRLANPDW